MTDYMDALGVCKTCNRLTKGIELDQEQRKALKAGLGDVLWYISALAYEIGYPLEIIALDNIAALNDRAARNIIKSEGDNR